MTADYDAFAETLRAIDKRRDVFVTIWQGERYSILGNGVQFYSYYVSTREVVLRVSVKYMEPCVWGMF